MNFKLTILALIISAFALVYSSAQAPLVYGVENSGDTCGMPLLPDTGQLKVYPFLPDPFEWSDGSGRVETFAEWECRRNEIKAEIEKYETGPKPPRPDSITATFSADSVLKITIIENGETLILTSKVLIPDGTGPFPVVIGMNSPTGSLSAQFFDGVIRISFMHDQVVSYNRGSGSRNLNDPFYKLYPDLTYVGKYASWSWGISRLIDGIEIVNEVLKANLSNISVTGCSYAGKMALFSGAFDERIALTIAQESGGGGVNSWRVAESLERNVEKIGNTNYSWFMQSMQTNFQGRPGILPHDHHELMAMIVPRALLVLGNPGWEWLGDEAGYIACKGAEEVYKAFGIEDRFGFSFRGEHMHCKLPAESTAEVQAFIDKFLHGDKTANTLIRVHDSFIEDVNPNYWINWPVNPNGTQLK